MLLLPQLSSSCHCCYRNAFKSFFQMLANALHADLWFFDKMSLLVKQFRMEMNFWLRWIRFDFTFEAHPPHYTSSQSQNSPISSSIWFDFFPCVLRSNTLCFTKLATFNHESLFLLSTFVFRLWIFIKCNLYTAIIACYIPVSQYYLPIASLTHLQINTFFGVCFMPNTFIRIFNLIKWWVCLRSHAWVYRRCLRLCSCFVAQ